MTTVAKAEVPDQLEKNRFYSHQLYYMYHKKIYEPEAHIMYLTVSSFMGGSGPNRVIKFLIAPERLEQGD